jgi:hypothetical protein
MLTGCNSDGLYLGSGYDSSGHYQSGYYGGHHGGSHYYASSHGSDDAIVGLVYLGIIAVPAIVDGIGQLIDGIW